MAAPAKVGCDLMKRLAFILLAGISLRAESFYITLAGLGGEAEYDQRFTGWAKDIDKVLHTAEPNAKIVTLFGENATKANIQARMNEVAKQAKADDSLVLMLIGHGGYDDVDYKFNIPGPDVSGTELAALLDKIPAKRQLVVNMTSSSGGSLVSLEKQGRVVITATKSGSEKNATYFARYWVEALRDPSADADKNEVISALEAFRYAERKTASFFDAQKRLATEHALIEDTGKGEGSRDPSPENGGGLVAGRFPLMHLGAVAAQVNDPEKQKLLKHKEDVEQKIDELKYQKAAMALDEYQKQMRAFLLDLAQTQEALDK
jgi:hypothetical protein